MTLVKITVTQIQCHSCTPDKKNKQFHLFLFLRYQDIKNLDDF